MKNERVDDLNLDGLKIIQNVNGYNFTSDSVLLANFVKAKNSKCLEIGTGSGIISILVNYKENPKKIIAFELQEEQACLARRNIELNNMEEKISIVADNIQNWNKYIEAGSQDVIFSNPPYFKFDPKTCCDNEQRIVSRSDKYLSIDDFMKCTSKILKYGGKVYFVYSTNRMSECFCAMEKFGIVPKNIYFVHPNETKNSSVFLCEAIKGGKPHLNVMPPLFTNSLDGDYIQTIQKLYKK